MALILQIETSTTSCSVALSDNGKQLAVNERIEANIHASHLTLFIKEVMKRASASYSDLAAIAVSKGPGSYTGLRIGVSTAKGLSYALDIPLIAVDTLYAMASGFRSAEGRTIGENTMLCPMIDARRMEVYTSLFDHNLKVIEPVQAKILQPGAFDQYLTDNQIVFFGDGAFKVRQIYPGSVNVSIADFYNSASHLVIPAYDKFMKKQFENVAYFEPYYLKDFVAGIPKS